MKAIIFILAAMLAISSFSSCNKEDEYLYPQPLTYKIEGGDGAFVAIWHNRSQSLARMLVYDYQEFTEQVEPGDSIYFYMIRANSLPSSAELWLGDRLIAAGSPDPTGAWQVTGNLVMEDFKK